MRVASLQTLEQGQSCAEKHVGRVAVALFNDVLGDTILNLGTGPVQVAENDGFSGLWKGGLWKRGAGPGGNDDKNKRE